MKRLFVLFLCLVMALSVIPAAAAENIEATKTEAEETVITAQPEDAVSNSVSGLYMSRADWEYDNHVLYLKHHEYVSGGIVEYAMYQDERPWQQYINDIYYIVLDEGCTGIEVYAFKNYPNLSSITIPYSVDYIYKGAFKNCPKLENVTLPYITRICDEVFQGCSMLSSLTIPYSVETIGGYAFEGTAISNLELPSSVTALENYALANMTALNTVTFTGPAPEIAWTAFTNVTATVYTPTGIYAWPYSAMQNYGGLLTWANAPTKPVITGHPISTTVPEGKIATFSVSADDASASYQWQYRTSSTASWKDCTVSSAKSKTLSIEGKSYRDGYQYRCKVSNAAGGTFSNSAALHVTLKPTITTQPKSQSAKEGDTVTFTVKATGIGMAYQWYYRTSSTGEWKESTVSGATTPSLSIQAKSYRNGYQYRCKVRNGVGYRYSNAATLTVCVKPAITTQPASKTASAGATVKFTVKATGNGLKYQWYYRTSKTGEWKKCTVASATTATLSIEAKSYRNGYQYRCKVSNLAGYKYSNAATLTVK